MRPADLDFAASCAAAEGWASETSGEFEAFFAHDANGCFVAEADGRPAGIAIATGYGACGFVGELIVLEGVRGRGIGRRLLDHAVAYLHGAGATSVLLDGVVRGVPLYERKGFRKVCRSLRFAGFVEGRARRHVRPMTAADLAAVCRIDAAAFGADRGFFLRRRLSTDPARCHVIERRGGIAGFVMGKKAGDGITAGPWIALPGAEDPGHLLEALAPTGGRVRLSLGVLDGNARAVATVRALGLQERADPPWRMVLGPTLHLGADPACHGIGSPAKG
jgi:ribosomal protein S18 acetylase RimI-like enzyme